MASQKNNNVKKLAVVSTHPIQYYAPWFRLLYQHGKVDVMVFYTWSQAKETVKDHNFGKTITWDVPLLEGYPHTFVENVAKKPGTHHFFGIQCPSLNQAVKDYSPDAILIFGWNFVSHLKLLRHFKGKIPIWFRGDSTLLDETPGYKTLLRRYFLRWVYTHVDKAFYVGQANKAYFLKHGLKEAQLLYAPHAIDNKRFSEPAAKYLEEALQWRKALGYKDSDLIALFVGKFEPKKQPLLLLSALKTLNQNRSQPLQGLFIGTGILEAELKQMAAGLDYIKFLPFQNQSSMPLIYRLGDVLCLPSRGPGETWGLAVNEAMACGTPVIVSDKVGCAIDLVTSQHHGYVFNYDDCEALLSILETLNKQTLGTMGSMAKAYIQDWSFEAIIKSIEDAMHN